MSKLKVDKGTKIFLIILILYLIIMLIIFLPPYLRYKNEKVYIVTSNYRLKYEYGKWSKNDIESSKKEKYQVYEDRNYIGIYKGLILNKIFLYDDSNNEVNYNGSLFLNRGSIKLDLVNVEKSYEISEIDKSIIDIALNEISIISDNRYNYSTQKISVDFDNDGILENVYSLDGRNESTNEVFSIVFLEDNGHVTIINKDTDTLDNIYDYRIFNLSDIIDIKKDKKFELIYTGGYSMGSIDEECVYLYDLSKKKEIKNFCEK